MKKLVLSGLMFLSSVGLPLLGSSVAAAQDCGRQRDAVQVVPAPAVQVVQPGYVQNGYVQRGRGWEAAGQRGRFEEQRGERGRGWNRGGSDRRDERGRGGERGGFERGGHDRGRGH